MEIRNQKRRPQIGSSTFSITSGCDSVSAALRLEEEDGNHGDLSIQFCWHHRQHGRGACSSKIQCKSLNEFWMVERHSRLRRLLSQRTRKLAFHHCLCAVQDPFSTEISLSSCSVSGKRTARNFRTCRMRVNEPQPAECVIKTRSPHNARRFWLRTHMHIGTYMTWPVQFNGMDFRSGVTRARRAGSWLRENHTQQHKKSIIFCCGSLLLAIESTMTGNEQANERIIEFGQQQRWTNAQPANSYNEKFDCTLFRCQRK